MAENKQFEHMVKPIKLTATAKKRPQYINFMAVIFMVAKIVTMN